MREPPSRGKQETARPPLGNAMANILEAARFVFRDPRVRLLLLSAMLFDSLVRLFLTFGSNYYRLIEIPEFVNGFLGSLYALLGFLAAGLARRMGARFSPVQAFFLVAVLIFTGLLGLCLGTPQWGVWVVIPLGLSMPILSFYVSSYLNEWTDSKIRATVLSFRGMALNIGYAAVGVGFASLLSSIRVASPGLSEGDIFGKALYALPTTFALGWLGIALFGWLKKVHFVARSAKT